MISLEKNMSDNKKDPKCVVCKKNKIDRRTNEGKESKCSNCFKKNGGQQQQKKQSATSNQVGC
jgi:hypothetical protein